MGSVSKVGGSEVESEDVPTEGLFIKVWYSCRGLYWKKDSKCSTYLFPL